MSNLPSQIKARLPRRLRDGAHAIHRWVMATPPVRNAVFDTQDRLDRLRGRADPLRPPRRLVHGIGSSLEVGETYLGHFRRLADLGPTEAVLDVGCGIGRMALPLTGYLTPPGRYEGFDIMRANVGWCRQAITPRFPHFRFRHLDVFNREYNPRGRVAGCDVRFPYADGSFDFAFLTSVFTHLLPADAERYLAELGRVLKPGGRCLATFFLVNAESREKMVAGAGHIRLAPFDGPAWTTDPATPEACVGLDEAFVRAAATRGRLALMANPYYGSWCGRDEHTDFQDICLLHKV